MNSALTRCPVCENELTITRLQCMSCDISIEGRFTGGHFAQLSSEQLDFIETFVRCEGKITRMEDELHLSYPTIRNRLHDVIRAMGYEPGKEETPPLQDGDRRSILEKLDEGAISADQALKLLRGEEN